jgi:hypothetical protein
MDFLGLLGFLSDLEGNLEGVKCLTTLYKVVIKPPIFYISILKHKFYIYIKERFQKFFLLMPPMLVPQS